MKKKSLLLLMGLCIATLWVQSQSNPHNEILVYFSEGVSQQTKTIKDKPVKTARFDKENVRLTLDAMGIADSLVLVAPHDLASPTP
jgi:hypothetical protein